MNIFESLTNAGSPIMVSLAQKFTDDPNLALYYTTISRLIFVVLAVFILLTAIFSLLRGKTPSEIWAYLSLPDGVSIPLSHWENVIGRSRDCDIALNVMTVSRNHATLIRDRDGNWIYRDLGSKGGSLVNGKAINGPTRVNIGDTITIGGVNCILVPPSIQEKRINLEARKVLAKIPSPWISLIALTVFQVMMCVQFIAAKGSDMPFGMILSVLIFTVVMWLYVFILRFALKRKAFEIEIIAFFLCTLNLAVVATSAPADSGKELIAIILGMIFFLFLCWVLRDLNRVLKIRNILIILSIILLLANLVFGTEINGSKNWIQLGSMTLQPSELVKIVFVFVGAATLNELFSRKHYLRFIAFSLFCLACLAVMRDFGTALIFFVTFLVVAFLRSGSLIRLVTAIVICGVGGVLALKYLPYVSARFATWGHIWEFPDAGGFQQVRGLTGAASGGLFGLGSCEGWLHKLVYADTDLVFTIITEEWGLIISILMVFAIVTLSIFAVRSISEGRAAYYTIAACAATSLLIFQTALNVLGSLDILPFTGVTLPLVSKGGTSIIACWGLLAFLKAADTRPAASLAVTLDTDTPLDLASETATAAHVSKTPSKLEQQAEKISQDATKLVASGSSKFNKAIKNVVPKSAQTAMKSAMDKAKEASEKAEDAAENLRYAKKPKFSIFAQKANQKLAASKSSLKTNKKPTEPVEGGKKDDVAITDFSQLEDLDK